MRGPLLCSVQKNSGLHLCTPLPLQRMHAAISWLVDKDDDSRCVSGAFDAAVHKIGGRVSYSNCREDGNAVGRHANTLLDDIQTRRQATLYSANGFGATHVYQMIGNLEPLAGIDDGL